MIPGDVEALKRALQKDPSMLRELDDAAQFAAAEAVVALEDARYALDPWAWVLEQVVTKDEADLEVKRFPDKAYLQDLFWLLENKQLLAIPKSRRMMVSWAVAAYMTHQARYRNHFAGYVQSDTETKAAYIVDQRIKFIEDNLPLVFRRPYREIRAVKGLVGMMTWAQTGGVVSGLAQGKDAFRTFTPTFIFMDEIEFQEQGHQSFVAALPFAEKKCKIVAVSSSGGPHGVLADMGRLANFERFS